MWQVLRKAKIMVVAWKNVLLPDKMKKIADSRIAICRSCVHRTHKIDIEICSVCNCPLKGKTYADVNTCPKNFWIN
jgi:hypothetical protein